MRLVLTLAPAALFLAACSSTDAATDAGAADSGLPDAGDMDAGPVDAGVDAGLDAGPTDGGPDAGDTWNSYAMGFFQTYCVSCHSPGGGDPLTGSKNFTQYSSVVQFAAQIRCGVSNLQEPDWNCPGNISARQFPVGGGPFPSDAGRNRLVAWIDAGMPQ